MFQQAWQGTWRFDRSKITSQQAIRGLVGFILPLALGVATGHVVEGVSIAGGASLLAAVGLNLSNRVRLRTMVLCSIGIALSAFVGTVTSNNTLLAILATGVWGFGAGMLIAVSTPMSVVGIQSMITLIVLSHFALDPLHAALQASLMFAGALFELILELFFTPWRRTDLERTALATVYAGLAELVTVKDISSNEKNLQKLDQLRDALTQAQSMLFEGRDRSLRGRVFLALYGDAERLRLFILTLHNLRYNLNEEKEPLQHCGRALDQIFQALSEEFTAIARYLESNQPKGKKRLSNIDAAEAESYQKLMSALKDLKQVQSSNAAEDKDLIAGILASCYKIINQLRVSRNLARHWQSPRKQDLAKVPSYPRPHWLRFYGVRGTLKVNFTFRSAIFRHAIRLAVTLMFATALYRNPAFPIGRGYWIVLSAFLVLKPDLKTTFTRGIARTLGTLFGAVITTLLISLLRPSLEVLVVLEIIFAYLAFSALFFNYAIFSMFTTVEVVILLAFVTPQPLITVADRAIDTLLGGVLALVIFAIWPTWERSQVYPNLARRLDTIRRYFVAVMEAFVYPGTYNSNYIAQLHRELRLTHSNADASVQRALQEPERYRVNVDLARGLVGAMDNLSMSILTLEAYLVDNDFPTITARYELALFTREVNQALLLLGETLHEKHPLIKPANVQGALRALEQAEKSITAGHYIATIAQHMIVEEARQIVNTLDVMLQLLPGPPSAQDTSADTNVPEAVPNAVHS
ncbi:hypothetical protein KDI_31010 [Dictyobacter arantiisoli]|uniref:Integral membrane bound transporter domain-containing protein n=2 Tax=Dictyobacter arantiisoli TaxID=2014874 RepID=A0A5A5TE01_9CHLR|nr:hypothetical protein KDI_31010 [Dictyobacter arantiisoli]